MIEAVFILNFTWIMSNLFSSLGSYLLRIIGISLTQSQNLPITKKYIEWCVIFKSRVKPISLQNALLFA